MEKQVYKVDMGGFFIEPIVIEDIAEMSSDCVAEQPPNGLYRAKWTGTEWVEDMTQEEIDELNNQPIIKTELEILQETVDMLVLDNLGVL